MSFGAGMGAGMGAGIGAGIAIGISSGKKQACEEIRKHFQANHLSIQDQTGGPVDIEEVLGPILNRECSNKKSLNLALGVLLALGILAFVLVLLQALR